MTSFHDKKPSQKIKDMMAMLPPVPNHWHGRPVTTLFRVLDSSGGRVLFTQWEEDDHSDRPSEGIAVFPPGFKAGVVHSDGEVRGIADIGCSRMVMMSYQSGWLITVLELPEAWPVTIDPQRLAARITKELTPESLQQEMILRVMGDVPRSYEEYLTCVHDYHRHLQRQHPHYDEPSITYA